MPDYVLGFGIGVLFFGSVIGFVLYKEFYLGDHRQRRRRYRAVPLLAISDVDDQAIAKVVGRVQSSTTPLRAPLTGRPCVAWQLEVRHIMQTGRARGGITRREWARRCQHFRLRGKTSTASIECLDPWLLVTTEVMKDLSSRNGFSPELHEVLAQDPRFDFNSFNQLRIIESVVQSEQIVGVVGVCEWQHDPGPVDGYRSPRTVLKIYAGEDSMLIGEPPS